jgi:hypothetical protein
MICTVGGWAYYENINKRSFSDKKSKSEDYQHENSDDESSLDGFLPVCPFFVRYARVDTTDNNSEFKLDRYQPFHSHSLTQDVVDPTRYEV